MSDKDFWSRGSKLNSTLTVNQKNIFYSMFSPYDGDDDGDNIHDEDENLVLPEVRE